MAAYFSISCDIPIYADKSVFCMVFEVLHCSNAKMEIAAKSPLNSVEEVKKIPFQICSLIKEYT